jgi:hypothetical protein
MERLGHRPEVLAASGGHGRRNPERVLGPPDIQL